MAFAKPKTIFLVVAEYLDPCSLDSVGVDAEEFQRV